MRFLLLSAALTLSILPVCAAEWPAWRGPHGTGVADGSEFPVEWSADSNIAWTTALAGAGGSTPAVAGDRIFLTLNADGMNHLLCYGMDGKEQWRRTLGKETPGRHRKATGANSSPVTDGELVYAYFSSGDLGCFTLDGEPVWSLNAHEKFGKVTKETLWWDLGNSPALIDGGIVLCCVQSGPSWVAAFRNTDGKVLWKVDRDLKAPEEANQSYSTPAVVRNADGSQTIVVLGSDYVTAHSATDGRELWRVGGLNPQQGQYFRSIASPVASQDVVLAPYARGATLTAIRMGGSGDVTASHVLYTKEGPSADVPTPVLYGDRAFVCGDGKQTRGQVFCLDVESGKILWSGRLPRHRATYSASPVIAGGRIYLTREDGTVFVVDAEADDFQLLSENQVTDEFTVATPVFVNGQILIRTHGSLTLVGG